jgi:hypothetical protein
MSHTLTMWSQGRTHSINASHRGRSETKMIGDSVGPKISQPKRYRCDIGAVTFADEDKTRSFLISIGIRIGASRIWLIRCMSFGDGMWSVIAESWQIFA